MAEVSRRDIIDEDEDAGLLDDDQDKAAAFLGTRVSAPQPAGAKPPPDQPRRNGANGHADADLPAYQPTGAAAKGSLTDISEAVARWDDGIQERMRRLDARMSGHERHVREIAELLHEIGGSRDSIGQRLKEVQKEIAAALAHLDQASQRADSVRPQVDELSAKINGLTTRADNSAKRLNNMATMMDDMLVMQSEMAASRARGTAMQAVALFLAAVAFAVVGYTQWAQIIALAHRLFGGA